MCFKNINPGGNLSLKVKHFPLCPQGRGTARLTAHPNHGVRAPAEQSNDLYHLILILVTSPGLFHLATPPGQGERATGAWPSCLLTYIGWAELLVQCCAVDGDRKLLGGSGSTPVRG